VVQKRSGGERRLISKIENIKASCTSFGVKKIGNTCFKNEGEKWSRNSQKGNGQSVSIQEERKGIRRGEQSGTFHWYFGTGGEKGDQPSEKASYAWLEAVRGGPTWWTVEKIQRSRAYSSRATKKKGI